MFEYVGNAPYCYANSAAMLLKSIGEDIHPGKIEVLTGVGLGAIWQDDGLFWLSNPYSPPDVGLSAALGILGFQFVEGSSEKPDPCPLEELEELLQTGPVVLGPLDMGYLDYLPFSAPGADHFVLAYQIASESCFFARSGGFSKRVTSALSSSRTRGRLKESITGEDTTDTGLLPLESRVPSMMKSTREESNTSWLVTNNRRKSQRRSAGLSDRMRSPRWRKEQNHRIYRNF